MSELNMQLKESFLEALEELYNAEDQIHADSLVELISEIRDDLNIIMLTNAYVETHIWSKIRAKSSNVQTLMATTSTFIQGIDDPDTAIKKYVKSFIPFTNKSIIVDNETISKAAEHTELERILLDNYWLFFLIIAATNKRILNGFLTSMIPVGKKKNGP